MAFVKMNEMIIICNNQVHIKHKPRVNNLNNINLKYFFHPTLWVFFTVEKKINVGITLKNPVFVMLLLIFHT